MAALSDIFGRPICLMVSLGLFTTATILCCVGKTLTVILVGRCVQGVGGGGVIILGLVIFTDIVPLRFRSKYYGIMWVQYASKFVTWGSLQFSDKVPGRLERALGRFWAVPSSNMAPGGGSST